MLRSIDTPQDTMTPFESFRDAYLQRLHVHFDIDRIPNTWLYVNEQLQYWHSHANKSEWYYASIPEYSTLLCTKLGILYVCVDVRN